MYKNKEVKHIFRLGNLFSQWKIYILLFHDVICILDKRKMCKKIARSQITRIFPNVSSLFFVLGQPVFYV